MKFNRIWRSAAAALALVMAMSVPAAAYTDGTDFGFDDGFEVLSGTAELPEEDSVSRTGNSVSEALNQALYYLSSVTTAPVVGTEGGEWSVMALARNGRLSDSVRNQYMAALQSALKETDGVLSPVKYTEYSRVILALSAMGIDPHSVGGYDLIQPLADYDSVCVQGLNGPVWALIALDSRNYEIPAKTKGTTQTSREGIISTLLENQYPGGGWSFGGRGLDDLTPMAIGALAPYYSSRRDVKTAVDAALRAWSSLQSADGGFADSGNSGKGGSEAISQTIMALSALDVNLIDSEMFVKNGNSLIDALLAYQADNGSFCHTKGDRGNNAIATDQAALALTAYSRAKAGKTRLFDCSDVPGAGGNREDAGSVAEFKKKLSQIPADPDLSFRDSVNTLAAELEQMGDFPEKESYTRYVRKFQSSLDSQKEEADALDRDIWNQIKPGKVTEDDRQNIQNLRGRYNSMRPANRAFLQYATDLFAAETELMENDGFYLAGTGKVPGAGKKPQKTESNTLKSEVKDGIVSEDQFRQIMDQDKNLKIVGKLADGKTYTMIINGKDVKTPADMQMGILMDSLHKEDILLLAESPLIFRFAQEGSFPGEMLVELPADMADGDYLLLRYNEAERRAEMVYTSRVQDGTARFIVNQGGEYFLTKKASAQSLNDQDSQVPQETQPEIIPGETDSQPAETDQNEILEGTAETGSNMGMIAVIAAVIIAAAVYYAVKKRKEAK